jgi:tRNA (guanine-N7-)-methyltransferase
MTKLNSDFNAVDLFRDPKKPLILDIGCAKGLFCFELATAVRATHNVLGVEIREPIAAAAIQRLNEEKAELVPHLAFLATNINVDLAPILAATETLSSVYISFPDPHFKKRNHKRRVAQPDLVAMIARQLTEGGSVFLQSDVREAAEQMRDAFACSPHLVDSRPPDRWDAEPPHVDILTSRQKLVDSQELQVWRARLYKR